MTHPKQALTPGDVVFDLCHRANTSYGVSRSLAHELAAAAIEAAKQSGDLFTREQVDSAMNFARGQGIAEGREQLRADEAGVQLMTDKKQSGNKPAFSCPKCGEPCSSNGCPKHTTPPTENKDERERFRCK